MTTTGPRLIRSTGRLGSSACQRKQGETPGPRLADELHRCAGSNLARLEMTVAIRVWMERIPEFHVSDRESMKWAGGQVRGPRILPMSFPPGAIR